MKVLQINTRYIGGGGAAYIANMLHSNLNKVDNFESFFLYGRGDNGDKKSYRITYPKVEYLTAGLYRVLGKEFNINKNFESYIESCDIVHLHNIHGYYIDLEDLFGVIKKYNKPVVWTLHDMWPLTGRCAYSFKCEKWKNKCGDCKFKELYPKTIFDRSKSALELKKKIIGSLNRDQLTIVTPSQWLADLCRESYLKKFKIQVVNNGIENTKIDKSKFELREKYNIDLKKKIVLFVAADANDERKGIKYILDVIPKCEDYLFVSIGKKLENINYDNFIQLGYISDRMKINEVYSMADVFVITSLEDNFPTTVIEAFSNSTPVIGFNIGGIPEQVTNDVGIILNNNTSLELEKELKSLLNDEMKIDTLSKNAFKKFVSKYQLNNFLDKYLKVYYNLKEKI